MCCVNICHESANLYVLNSGQIIQKTKMHWIVLDESEISVKRSVVLTLATPHSYWAASVRSTKAFPVTALWAVLIRVRHFGN